MGRCDGVGVDVGAGLPGTGHPKGSDILGASCLHGLPIKGAVWCRGVFQDWGCILALSLAGCGTWTCQSASLSLGLLFWKHRGNCPSQKTIQIKAVCNKTPAQCLALRRGSLETASILPCFIYTLVFSALPVSDSAVRQGGGRLVTLTGLY